MVEAADIIFVMDHRNYREIVGRFPTARAKTYFLGAFAGDDEVEIVDPYSDDPYSEREQTGRRCYHKLIRALDGLRARILIDEKTSSSHGLLA
jgi:protein-tyrosine-phosphatase